MRHAMIWALLGGAALGCTPSGAERTTITLPAIRVSLTQCVEDDCAISPTLECRRSETGSCFVTLVRACDGPEAAGEGCRTGYRGRFELASGEQRVIGDAVSPLYFCASTRSAPTVQACQDMSADPAPQSSVAAFMDPAD